MCAQEREKNSPEQWAVPIAPPIPERVAKDDARVRYQTTPLSEDFSSSFRTMHRRPRDYGRERQSNRYVDREVTSTPRRDDTHWHPPPRIVCISSQNAWPSANTILPQMEALAVVPASFKSPRKTLDLFA